ncbi:MAG: SH3 domain-containing protein [Alphaproteobacteria bacterium]
MSRWLLPTESKENMLFHNVFVSSSNLAKCKRGLSSVFLWGIVYYFGFVFSLAEAVSAVQPAAVGFASLKSSEVNVRTGPGSHYPICWVLVRKSLPVKVLADFDNWRKIEDFEGKQGWVHQSLLSAKQTILILENEVILRNAPCLDSGAIARLEKGVIASLLEKQGGWCYINIEKTAKGWVPCRVGWGNIQEKKG